MHFLIGGVFPLLDMLIQQNNNNNNNNKNQNNDVFHDSSLLQLDGSWLFIQRYLQEYLLVCCQDREGGFKDKPGKGRDYYHTW